MKIFIFGLVCLWSLSSVASGIRTVYVNDSKMQRISLRMGKATVLRFPEKPKKVVIGNQNYHSVEFIDNDVTIQPLGDVSTNLFIYTPYHTYGFLLNVCHSCAYDDLVYVKWKSKFSPRKRAPRKKVVHAPVGFQSIGLRFSVGKNIEVLVSKTMNDSTRGIRFVDMTIKNTSESTVNTSGLSFFATRASKPLGGQGFVVEKDKLNKEEIGKARLFLPSREQRGFTLNGVMGESKGKVIIWRKYLQ